MPEDQSLTQNVKAPSDGTTPNDPANSPGQGADPPEGEGGKYTEEQAERWKQQAEGGKQEVEKLKADMDLLRSSNTLLTTQVNTPAPAPIAAPVGPTYDPNTFLTPEEETAEEKAYEDLNRKDITKFTRLASSRQHQAAQDAMLQNMGTAANQMQSVNSVTADLNAATEFKDATLKQKLLAETIAAMRDPAQSGKYAEGQMNVDGVGINPFILMDKLKDHRIAKGVAVKSARTEPESHAVMEGDGPSSALPGGSPDTFDPTIHLTASERSGGCKGDEPEGDAHQWID